MTIRRRQWLTVLLVLLLGAPVVGVAAYRARGYRVSTSDFDDFHKTAVAGLFSGEARGMPTEWGVFNYHPFFMVVMAPLGFLPMPAACGVFVAVSMALFCYSVHVVVERLDLVSEHRRRLVAFGSVLMVSPYLLNSLLLGQFECLLVFLLVMAWKLGEDRRDFTAGLCIAAAVLIKAYPGVLLLWYVFKRKHRTLTGALAGFVIGAGILPSLLFGVEENANLHRQWFERVVVGNSALNELVKTEGSLSWYNIEALPITLRRYLTPQPYTTHVPDNTINFATLPATPIVLGPVSLQPLQWVYVLLAGGILLAVCWVIRHPAARIAVRRQRLEYGLMILLGLVLSPMNWAARYFLLAWFGVALLCAELATGEDRCRPDRFSVFVALVWAATLFMWAERLRAYSVHFWAVVLLAVWLAVRAGRAGLQSTAGQETNRPARPDTGTPAPAPE